MSKLTRARAALHAALAGGQTPAERTHLYPQNGQYPTPCAWVGLATVETVQNTTALTVPVVLALDGTQEAQVAALDAETARLWDALRAVKLDGVKARPQAAVPERLGPEGSNTLGVIFTVELDLITQTLCEQTLAEQP